MTFEVNINFEDSWHDVGTDLEWISPLNLSDGFYTFKVRTKDIAGNRSEDDYFGFWVDNGIPETPIFESDEFSMFTRPYFKWNHPFDVDFGNVNSMVVQSSPPTGRLLDLMKSTDTVRHLQCKFVPVIMLVTNLLGHLLPLQSILKIQCHLL